MTKLSFLARLWKVLEDLMTAFGTLAQAKTTVTALQDQLGAAYTNATPATITISREQVPRALALVSAVARIIDKLGL